MVVIRYQGTSPKLGTSQGECPYCELKSPFGGEEGDGGDDEVVASHFKVNRYSNL